MYFHIHILKYMRSQKVKKPIYVWLTYFSRIHIDSYTILEPVGIPAVPYHPYNFVHASPRDSTCIPFSKGFFLYFRKVFPLQPPFQRASSAYLAGRKYWKLAPSTLKQCLMRAGTQIVQVPHILCGVFYNDFQSLSWEIILHSPTIVAGLKSNLYRLPFLLCQFSTTGISFTS